MANAHFNAPVHATCDFRTISVPRCGMAFAFLHYRCRNFAGCATPQEISYRQRHLTHLIKTKRAVVVGMSAPGPKLTCACALHMSAFGGKADIDYIHRLALFSNRATSIDALETTELEFLN